MLTNDEVAIVQGTWAKVVPIAEMAATIFYDRLFETAPEVRALFPDDLTEQKKKLMQMIGTAVGRAHHLEQVIPALQELGRRHLRYGAEPEHYAVVGESLLWTLGRGLGHEFTPEVRDAWAKVYGLLARTMIDAANDVEEVTSA